MLMHPTQLTQQDSCLHFVTHCRPSCAKQAGQQTHPPRLVPRSRSTMESPYHTMSKPCTGEEGREMRKWARAASRLRQ